MTANQDQIQRLLTEVQEVLALSVSRLPWGASAKTARQRQVLEQVEAYLKQSLFQLNQQAATVSETQAQDVMQSVVEEMTALRSTLLRPLHSEVATLMQQRNALAREVRQLEAHRQMLTQPAQFVSQPDPKQNQADQALTALDSSLHVVFESLQKDIQAYHESLSHGIDKLHRLGQQSEAMVSNVVERLTTQIERDTSAFLQSSSATPLPAQAALTMPYAGAELVSSRSEAPRSSSIESITSLTQLLDRLEIDDFPTSIPATPPRNGNSGREVASELKQLFQADLPRVEPAIDALAYSELNQETTLEQLNASMPSLSKEPVVFTLEDIETLFVDESKNQ